MFFRKNKGWSVKSGITVIRITEEKSILFFAFSHLLLDGTGITQIVRELAGSQKLSSDRQIWNRRIRRMYDSDHTASISYWKNLLKGLNGFAQIPMKQNRTGVLQPEQNYAIGGSKLLEAIRQYCRNHQITLSAYMHFAFGRTLMELLGTDDICFLSEGNLRTAAEAKLAWMCILRFPVRMHRGMTLTECQAQLAASMENMEVCGIRGTEWDNGFGRYNGVLDVQNVFFEKYDKKSSKCCCAQ